MTGMNGKMEEGRKTSYRVEVFENLYETEDAKSEGRMERKEEHSFGESRGRVIYSGEVPLSYLSG